MHLGLAAGLLQIPLSVLEAGYSKEQELQADQEGLRLAVHSGYSPAGGPHAFRQTGSVERTPVPAQPALPRQILTD